MPRTGSRRRGHAAVALSLSFILLAAAPPLGAAEPVRLQEYVLPGGTETELRVAHAKGEIAVLWLPCDQGLGTAEARAAARLAEAGVEVWLADLLGAHFLPVQPSSMEQIDPGEVAALIDYVQRQSGKTVVLAAGGRAAVPALRGARAWQARAGSGQRPLGGAILFYPELYTHLPPPGEPARYLPVVHQSHLPVVILQPAQTPGRWWLPGLKRALEQGGSRVHTKLLPGVRGYFYIRADSTPAEDALAARLPELVSAALETLQLRTNQP